jgi:hypothetical protein
MTSKLLIGGTDDIAKLLTLWPGSKKRKKEARVLTLHSRAGAQCPKDLSLDPTFKTFYNLPLRTKPLPHGLVGDTYDPNYSRYLILRERKRTFTSFIIVHC